MHDANFWRKYARMWIDAVDLGLQLGMNFDARSLKVESESIEHFEKELSLLSDSKRHAVQTVLSKQQARCFNFPQPFSLPRNP